MVVLSGCRGEHPLEHGGKRGPIGVAAGSHEALTVALKDACANGMTHGVLGPGGDVGGITEQPQGSFGQRLFFILGVAVEEAGHLALSVIYSLGSARLLFVLFFFLFLFFPDTESLIGLEFNKMAGQQVP